MPKVTEPRSQLSVGVIGAGQLALMMAEAAVNLPLTLALLAGSNDEAACAYFDDVTVGSAQNYDDVTAFARRFDATTFDHELVNLDAVITLEDDAVAVFPDAAALRFAVDKAYQRVMFRAEHLPVPDFVILESFDQATIDAFTARHPEGVVVKSARGGYDGRGVEVLAPGQSPREVVANFLTAGTVVLEARMELLGEVAILIASDRHGQRVAYPAVDTVQRDGICVEVNYPSSLSDAQLSEANAVALAVAELVNAVGILAVELFVTPTGIVINEVATRPHNSGHWTIEGTTVSQFENHLRGISGLPVVAPEPVAPFATMVNVIGSERSGDLAAAQAVAGAFVHDYGKAWRRGRKLGHVTVVGDNRSAVATTAWDAAMLLQPSN